jgi:hypothetical protein
MWSETEEERAEVTIKEEKAKDKHEECTKERNGLWNIFRRWRRQMLKKLGVYRSEPFIKEIFIS